MHYTVIMDRIRHEYFKVPVEADSPEQAKVLARDIAKQKRLTFWDMVDSEEEWEIIEARATPTVSRCS